MHTSSFWQFYRRPWGRRPSSCAGSRRGFSATGAWWLSGWKNTWGSR
jgi:hypothetical protein